MQESKYWIFKIMEADFPKDYRQKLEKYTCILTSIRDKEVKPDHIDSVMAKASHYINKNDKADPYYYVILLMPKTIKKTEATQIAHSVKGKFATMIPDQDPIDMDLKKKLRSLTTSNVDKSYDPEQFTYFGTAKWCSNSDNKWSNLQHYFYPYNYSKPQLLKYRYWTQKCFDYLPSPTDYYNNSTYKTEYPVYSQDDIERVELSEPVKTIIAKKKKRLTDPEAIKKHKEVVAKVKATKLVHQKAKEKIEHQQLQDQAKSALAQFDHDIDIIKHKYSKSSQMLIAFKYLAIANHLAKSLQEINYQYDSYYSKQQKLSKLDNYLIQKYTTDELYKIKNQALERLYIDNFKYNKSCSSNITLQAVIPENPDKISVYFCEEHNDERYMFGASPLEYYYECQNEIDHCPYCKVTKNSNYYSFYYFTIKVGDIKYDWHLPYPLGQSWLPNLHELPQIEQIPNDDSPFLYGETANKNEKLIANARDILTPILNYIDKSKLDTEIKQLYDNKHKSHLQIKYYDAYHNLKSRVTNKFLTQDLHSQIIDMIQSIPKSSDDLTIDQLRDNIKKVNILLTKINNALNHDDGYQLFKWLQKHKSDIASGKVRADDWYQYNYQINLGKKLLDNYSADNSSQINEAHNILETLKNQHGQLQSYIKLCKKALITTTIDTNWTAKHLDLDPVTDFNELQQRLIKALNNRDTYDQIKLLTNQISQQKSIIQQLKHDEHRKLILSTKSPEWKQTYQNILDQFEDLCQLCDQLPNNIPIRKKLTKYIRRRHKQNSHLYRRTLKELQQISDAMTRQINNATQILINIQNNN